MAPKKSGGASASGSDDKSKEKKGGTSIKVTFVTKNIKYPKLSFLVPALKYFIIVAQKYFVCKKGGA